MVSREEMVRDLRTLAERFSEGWHDGIKIDALDIELLVDAAQALAEQPAQQWCSCEPTKCYGVGRCRWQAMNYSPLDKPAQQERAEVERLRSLCDEMLSELYVYRASEYLKDVTAAIQAGRKK